jgi:hypothetical protein
MAVIFVGQSALIIKLYTGTDISGALDRRVYYRKPDGTEGYWQAEVEDATDGVIAYEVASDGSDLDQAGTWVMWAWVKFANGREANGVPIDVTVNQVGKGGF